MIKRPGKKSGPTAEEFQISDKEKLPPEEKKSVSIIMKLPKPLEEALQKIYQGLGELGGYIANVEKKADLALERLDNLDKRVDSIDSRLSGVEEIVEDHRKRLTKLEDDFRDFQSYVKDRFDLTKTALREITEAIKAIPYQYAKIEEAQPGEPGAIATEDGKWIKLITTSGPVGSYRPVKEKIEKASKYIDSL